MRNLLSRIPLGRGLVSDSVILSVLLVIATAAAVMVVVVQTVSAKIEQAADQRLAIGARFFSNRLDETAADLTAVGEWLVNDLEFQRATETLDSRGLERQLASAIRLTAIDEAAVADRNGAIVARLVWAEAVPRPVDNLSGSGLAQARAGRHAAGVGKTARNLVQQELYLPVPGQRRDAPAGVLRLSADLDQERLDRFREVTGLDASVFLQGDRLVTTLRREGAPLLDVGPDPGVYEEVVGAGNVATRWRDLPVGQVRSAYVPIKGPDGSRVGMFSVSLPTAAILGEWWDAAARSAAVFATVVGLGAGLAYLVARRVREPVLALAAAATRLREGDLSTPIPLVRELELVPLAHELEEARASLRANLETVAAEEARERAIFDTMQQPVFVADGGGRVLRVNRAATDFFGAGVEATNVYQLLPFMSQDDVRSEGKRWQGAIELRSGQRVDLEVGWAKLEGGALPSAEVFVVHDVSHHAELSRTREELLYNLAHELRSPLAVLDNSLEILSTELSDLTAQEMNQLVASARRTSARLRALMDDLLSAGNIEAGKFLVRPQPVAFDTVLESAVEAVDSLLESKQQRIVRELPDRLMVMADRRYVRQVLTNILSNASKYGPAGKPVLVQAGSIPGHKVRIAVQDRGPGIPTERQTNLFQRFYRGTSSDREPGIGLGRAKARTNVEAPGGDIGVESAEGVGTTVWFTLPSPQKMPQ